jgi:hypothetical protein
VTVEPSGSLFDRSLLASFVDWRGLVYGVNVVRVYCVLHRTYTNTQSHTHTHARSLLA